MKKYDDDDGRQIADMSHVDSSLGGFSTARLNKRKKKKDGDKEDEGPEVPPLTRRETKALMFRAMWTSLLIALVFIALAAIFLLFAVYVWFR